MYMVSVVHLIYCGYFYHSPYICSCFSAFFWYYSNYYLNSRTRLQNNQTKLKKLTIFLCCPVFTKKNYFPFCNMLENRFNSYKYFASLYHIFINCQKIIEVLQLFKVYCFMSKFSMTLVRCDCQFTVSFPTRICYELFLLVRWKGKSLFFIAPKKDKKFKKKKSEKGVFIPTTYKVFVGFFFLISLR